MILKFFDKFKVNSALLVDFDDFDFYQIADIYDRAIAVLLYIMRAQLFIDGNKRTAVVFANHILISHGAGLLTIPDSSVAEFKQLLVKYYETGDSTEITKFLSDNCLTKI